MEEEKISVNNLGINYKIFGNNNNLPVLVLHGWGIGSDSWVETAVLLAQAGIATPEHFTKAGYKIIVPDMPGFGKSRTPDKPWRVDDYVEWLKNFADGLKLDNFVLLGHSFGGQVAVKFCAAYPNKVGKLILCAAAIIRKPRLGSRQILAKYLAKTKVIFQNIPFGIYPVLRKIVYRIAGTKDYGRLQGVMAQTFLNVVGETVLDSAKKISIPTLIVWGNKDNETPLKDAREINQAIAGSQLEIVNGAGHKLHRTHTAKLASILISFLNLKS